MIMNKHFNSMPKVQILAGWKQVQSGEKKSNVVALSHSLSTSSAQWVWSSEFPSVYDLWAYLDLFTSPLGWLRDLYNSHLPGCKVEILTTLLCLL